MAALHEINEPSGIKLFGTTISLKEAEASSQPSDLTHDEEDPKKSDETVEKRPDKIIPCPRCKSTETKFCYFNNYNVNQPRHFCKGCQRYWTAGGALRSVPVGAGRRKNKPPGMSVFDASVVQQLDFDTVVEEWQVAEHGGHRQLLGAKKRRLFSSNGQSLS